MVARSTRAGGAIFMPIYQFEIQFIRMLSDRLERISADSVWAHRASGIRGALLQILDEDIGRSQTDPKNVKLLITAAMQILTQAAKRE